MTRFVNINTPAAEKYAGKRTVESAARMGDGYRGRKIYGSQSDARMGSYGVYSMGYEPSDAGRAGKAAKPTQSSRIDMMDGERDY